MDRVLIAMAFLLCGSECLSDALAALSAGEAPVSWIPLWLYVTGLFIGFPGWLYFAYRFARYGVA